MSGHEFGLLLGEVDSEAVARDVARRLLDALDAPLTIREEAVSVSIRLGIAMCGHHGEDGGTLMRNAELAAHSRATAESVFTVYSPELDHQAREHRELETALHQALDEEAFFLEYQPKVQATTGRIVGMEALLRWQRAGAGVVSPAKFVPALEASGLIVPVGAWVLRKACADYVHLQAQHRQPLTLAVNLSVKQLATADLVATVADILEDTGMPAQRLELEITESCLVDNPQATLETLEALKALGVRLAIDDFGTDYSALSYLRDFPVDTLKIDRSFVRDVERSPEAAAIAKMVIALADSLRLEVIAEGAETESQLAVLYRHGCELPQGYYFSRPVSFDQFQGLSATAFPIPAIEVFGQQDTLTLLLLDDETSVLAALERTLRGEEYRVFTAADPDDAFDLLATHHVDVLLCGQQMKAMTGIEFMRWAKALYPDTTRLILSGYTGLETLTEAVNSGVIDKFLFKPWDSDELRQSLRTIFEDAKGPMMPSASESCHRVNTSAVS